MPTFSKNTGTLISRLLITFLLLNLVIVLFSSPGFTQEQNAIVDTTRTTTDSTSVSQGEIPFDFSGRDEINVFGMVAKTIAYLSLIIILILGIVYVLKNYVYNKKNSITGANALKVLGSSFVAPKKSIMLVETVGKVLLLGVTESNMSLLTELKKEDYELWMEESKKVEPGGGIGPAHFGDVLTKILKRKDNE